MDDRKRKGQRAEDVAEFFLYSRGLKIIERNFSSRWGEIDIIAKDGKFVVFVEVRSSFEGPTVHPLESITKKKQSRILKTATWYLKKEGLIDKVPVRFDTVIVMWREGTPPEIEWIKGAFTV